MLKRLFRKTPKTTYRLTIRGFDEVVDAREDRSILDAALDLDLPFPHNCCVGECGTCLCRVVEGEVEEQIDTSHLVSDEERADGFVLGCQSHPRSDVVVEIPDLEGPSVSGGRIVG